MKNSPFAYVISSKISALTFEETINSIKGWVEANDKKKYVCVCNTHSLVTASNDEKFSAALERASICTPDGMPLVWALKMFGYKKQDRVDGPDLMLNLCEEASKHGYKIYLYGGTKETLERLNKILERKYPAINIVGSYSPPFRELEKKETEAILQEINSSQADFVFVSLGCPKQEKWMHDNYLNINSVLLGVGAAFNFITGDIKRPPVIIRKLGLEWFFRLLSEPKRLFKRYLYNNTLYIYKFVKTYIKNKKRNTLILSSNNIEGVKHHE
ncbi:WecB/TagA/CpsF family glycosyltransferase [Priestia aryabhattai]|uniref:WecB/TagA/CpsF family glycosyltransferase n=1 Tax=Priestia aryabhattai TaxID=412384 RepID=UPI002E23FA84|nr:WecB/TagA/CpsF family glycosyltransferase [Priestia aryabhattai]MED4261171.1 WecB/TagA/CpsF family glycosyltransferase [Priestia aryabhattai]